MSVYLVIGEGGALRLSLGYCFDLEKHSYKSQTRSCFEILQELKFQVKKFTLQTAKLSQQSNQNLI